MTRVFIAGGTGYIGSATVVAAQRAGLTPVVLTRSKEKAAKLEKSGVEVLVGDLEHSLIPPTRCELAIFLAAPPTWGKRVSRAVAKEFRDGLLRLTCGFLELAEREDFKRIIFIAGTSFYGDAGDGAPRSEEFASAPKGWGPYLAPAVEMVTAFSKTKRPVTIGFPGQVYGAASWNEQLFLKPVMNGKAVTVLKGREPLFSPIHLDDCARAIVHLLSRTEPGGRYLLVDDQPIRARAFAEQVAVELGRPLRLRPVPEWLASVFIGPVLTEYATAHTNFSNAKLKSTGFEFRYPTVREGLPEVVRQWRAA